MHFSKYGGDPLNTLNLLIYLPFFLFSVLSRGNYHRRKLFLWGAPGLNPRPPVVPILC